MAIDKLDRQIVRLLQEDARASYKSIGDRLGVSHNTVRARALRMLEDGVIRFNVVTMPAKVGLTVTAFIGLKVSPAQLDHVAHELMGRREISYLGHTVGNFDLLVLAHFADNEELFQFSNRFLAQICGVDDIENVIVTRTLRGLPHSYRPMLDGDGIGEDAGELPSALGD